LDLNELNPFDGFKEDELPYSRAIKQLNKINDFNNPRDKFNVLIRM
jgi:hypothetical protein